MSSTIVVGLDGAGPGTWVAVRLADGHFAGAVRADLEAVLRWCPDAAVVAVDIPVGNLDWGGRLADGAARELLGRRRSTLFAAPPLECLEMDDYAEANAQLTARGLPRMSRQAWGLREKVLEVDALARHDERIVECHPELSFRAMAGRVLASPKTTWAGVVQRRALLERHGVVLPDDLGAGAGAGDPPAHEPSADDPPADDPPADGSAADGTGLRSAGTASPDDVLDAAACAWTAARVAAGIAEVVPGAVELDSHGRRIAIWS